MPFQSLNPYNSELLAQFPFEEDALIQSKIEQAETVFQSWKNQSFAERGKLFHQLANRLREEKEELGRLITLEMGKPIRESVAEIEKCALTADYYADHAVSMLQTVHVEAGSKAEIQFRPLGVIFGIFPWNYPVWQVLRFAIPTLMAGNTAVFKHAENTPQCALAIVRLMDEAGFPKGILNHLFASIDQVEDIISHPHIHAVTLTGSERAGRSVAALAGKHLKKVVLELGGSDPFIVMPNAELKKAAKIGVLARYQNSGQSCIAAKRFLIHESVYDDFLGHFKEELVKLVPGDPLDPATTLGVLARKDLSEQLEKQLSHSTSSGAKLKGGQRVGATGFAPGYLEDVPENAAAYSEELFGPVAGLYRFQNEAEAIALANTTNFGLGASVWTADEEQFRRMAKEIESGMVYWNSMVKSTPELPFGGTKNSGIGRELSLFGIHEFTNIQLMYPF